MQKVLREVKACPLDAAEEEKRKIGSEAEIDVFRKDGVESDIKVKNYETHYIFHQRKGLVSEAIKDQIHFDMDNKKDTTGPTGVERIIADYLIFDPKVAIKECLDKIGDIRGTITNEMALSTGIFQRGKYCLWSTADTAARQLFDQLNEKLKSVQQLEVAGSVDQINTFFDSEINKFKKLRDQSRLSSVVLPALTLGYIFKNFDQETLFLSVPILATSLIINPPKLTFEPSYDTAIGQCIEALEKCKGRLQLYVDSQVILDPPMMLGEIRK